MGSEVANLLLFLYVLETLGVGGGRYWRKKYNKFIDFESFSSKCSYKTGLETLEICEQNN